MLGITVHMINLDYVNPCSRHLTVTLSIVLVYYYCLHELDHKDIPKTRTIVRAK